MTDDTTVARYRAATRMLLADGHITPAGARMLNLIGEAEVIRLDGAAPDPDGSAAVPCAP